MWGCFGEPPASSQSQRRIGEARLQEDLLFSVTFGAVRGFDEDEIVVRQASPTMRMTVESGPDADHLVDVELRNVHLDAELQIVFAETLDSEAREGCPIATAVDVDCVRAREGIGTECQTSGQCAEGLRCAAESCQPSDLFALCVPPDTKRLEGQETSISFRFDVDPCRRIRLATDLPPETTDEALRFAVVGPTRDDELLADLRTEFDAADLDFIALLGDNASSASPDALDDLERTAIRLGAPVVALAGPREVAADAGEAFLRRFGPHDHVWMLKGSRFFAFYSALGALGPRGFERLETFLVQLEERADPESPGPLIGLTHAPPLDPDGLRDSGFRNDIEGARVLSLLQRHGVHQLYAGALGVGEERVHDMDVIVTTAAGTLVQRHREWILVEVLPADEDGERVIGGKAVRFERIPIER